MIHCEIFSFKENAFMYLVHMCQQYNANLINRNLKYNHVHVVLNLESLFAQQNSSYSFHKVFVSGHKLLQVTTHLVHMAVCTRMKICSVSSPGSTISCLDWKRKVHLYIERKAMCCNLCIYNHAMVDLILPLKWVVTLISSLSLNS